MKTLFDEVEEQQKNEVPTVSFTKVTNIGFADCAENDIQAVAKKINYPETNLSLFYLKQNSRINGGIFYNVNADNVSSLSEIDARKGKNRFEFTKVNEETYDYYMQFLETKNEAFLKLAERNFNATRT